VTRTCAFVPRPNPNELTPGNATVSPGRTPRGNARSGISNRQSVRDFRDARVEFAEMEGSREPRLAVGGTAKHGF